MRGPSAAAQSASQTVTAAIDALCAAIARTATIEEVVAELGPMALARLARDAELCSAWLGAVATLAESVVKRHGAGQGAPIAPSEAHGGCK
jgi:hypothetical protein